LGNGLERIPSKEEAKKTFNPDEVMALEEKRRSRQKLIFRTYATRSCAPNHS
jgi:hypothetical protein